MGVLCYLASEYPKELRPRNLYLFYVHIKEHSPGTTRFVADGIRYAKRHFENVVWGYHNAGSVLAYFSSKKIIPHPVISPCSAELKMEPIERFREEHGIEVDLIGYLRSERRRMNRAIKHGALEQGKHFIIRHLWEQDVFRLVEREIGWYPPIYHIRDETGIRVFKHNNCLPCKNMQGRLDETGASGEFAHVLKYYPEHARAAMALSKEMGAYWGRDKNFDGHCGFCEV